MFKQLHELRGDVWVEPKCFNDEHRALHVFLNMPVNSPDKIFDLFGKLPNAVVQHGEGTKGFVYVPGTRKDRCVLVAHADTYFDSRYPDAKEKNAAIFDGTHYKSKIPGVGIGADDRAGCAILWLLRNSGHSLLVLDGEEHGQTGANYLKNEYPDLYSEINNHAFILEVDKSGDGIYKTYDIPVTESFRKYIEEETSYTRFEGKGRTDICVLCDSICGVNISIGYHDEHKETESLCYNEWEKAYFTVKNMVEKPLKKYCIAE